MFAVAWIKLRIFLCVECDVEVKKRHFLGKGRKEGRKETVRVGGRSKPSANRVQTK